jgi:hypothetical protein
VLELFIDQIELVIEEGRNIVPTEGQGVLHLDLEH